MSYFIKNHTRLLLIEMPPLEFTITEGLMYEIRIHMQIKPEIVFNRLFVSRRKLFEERNGAIYPELEKFPIIPLFSLVFIMISPLDFS
ncbi:MAG: hypothetical protein AAF363_07880 [Bacteroidota bacterium]